MNSCSATYCISATSQNNVRLSDIFQLTTLILIMCIVFLHWTIRTLNRTTVCYKLSWFPIWCHYMSLILFQPGALSNTVVQCKAFEHRSDWVAPRAHTLPRDSTPPLTVLLLCRHSSPQAGPQVEDHALPFISPPLQSSVLPGETNSASWHCSGHHDALCNMDLPWCSAQYGWEPWCAPALLPLQTHR